MSVKFKDKEAAMSAPKRTITAENVHIEDGVFVDENGNIASEIIKHLLTPIDNFKITIAFELPEDNE